MAKAGIQLALVFMSSTTWAYSIYGRSIAHCTLPWITPLNFRLDALHSVATALHAVWIST